MMLSVGMMAQDVKCSDSYNYTRGVEAIQNNNIDEGVKFLQKEGKQNFIVKERSLTFAM